MICPSCNIETRIQEVRTEYVYPNLFWGMPTFWGFMSPAVAKFVTVCIAVLGVAMGVVGIWKLRDGSLAVAIAPLLIFALTVYVVIVGVISLGKYHIKKHYRCLSCHLDWYEVDGKE